MAKSQFPQQQNAKGSEKVQDKNPEKNRGYSKDSNTCCTNSKYLKNFSWLLLIFGVAIALTIFYLVIKQPSGINIIDALDGEVEDTQAKSLLFVDMEGTLGASEEIEDDESNTFDFIAHSLSLVKNLNRCKEDSCKIVCSNVKEIFTAIDDEVKNSECPTMNALWLENQDFPSGVLKNDWLQANVSFNEVVIDSASITSIKKATFNVSFFHNTSVLSLYNRHLIRIEEGALLGFERLTYLTIQSYLKQFPPSILQPVQHTLHIFKLSGHLSIEGTKNPFEGILLENLHHLEVSRCTFNCASLGKKFFESTPNLRHVIMTENQLQHIEQDAFETLTDKLLYLNLEKNSLTTIASEMLLPMLISQHKTVINLADNNWVCDCQLNKFAELYKAFLEQFSQVLYCKAPHHSNGVALNEVDFDLKNCSPEINPQKGKGLTITRRGLDSFRQETATDISNNTPLPPQLKMSCSDEEDISSSDESENLKRYASDSDLYLELPPPDVEFDLILIHSNNNVKVTIQNPRGTYLVIWFSEQRAPAIASFVGEEDLDYECMHYSAPYLEVGPLHTNTTYTFCILPEYKNDISPFNCLPLYVPLNSIEDVWISADKKRLTIGMLCLTFLLSTLAGSIIAYLGIRAFPDVLEGSRNSSILNKTEQSYVTAISEIDYQKQSSLKTHRPCAKQQSITKQPLPDTPPPDTEAMSGCMSAKDLERVLGTNLAPASLEDTLPCYTSIPDGYERPKSDNDEYVATQSNEENMYCAAPRIPPPLPERNSGVSNSSTLVLNRLSKHCDAL